MAKLLWSTIFSVKKALMNIYFRSGILHFSLPLNPVLHTISNTKDSVSQMLRRRRFSTHILTLFRMGGGAKRSPYQFFPCNFYKRRIWHSFSLFLTHFLTFSFNLFVTLVQNIKFVPSASPKLLNLNQDHSSKKVIFPVKSL